MCACALYRCCYSYIVSWVLHTLGWPDLQLARVDHTATACCTRSHVLTHTLAVPWPQVLEALNRLLDDNRELLVPELQEVVKPHPHFMLFATQNPPGAYAGRKVLSRAFRSRWAYRAGA